VPLTLGNGDLLGVDARTGATKWTRRHAGTSDGGSPINVSAHIEGTVGDVLLATRSKVGEPPFLEGYDLRTGKRRWRVQNEAFRYDFATTTGEDLFTIPASQGPLVVQQRSLRTGAVTATETYTGGDGIGDASSEVRVSNTNVVVGVSQQPQHVVVFDRVTRAQAWQADGQLDSITADRVLVDTTTGDWSLLALDAASGAVTWTVHHGWGARVLDERRLVVNVGTIGSSRGVSASAVDATTGAALWTRTEEPSAVPGTTATTTLVAQPGCVPGASTDPKPG
jgi:outer membrane protein assembly factor BamB